MFAIKNIPHYFNTDHRVLQLLFYAEGCFLRAAGIICEYDPFHLGHRYQIGRVRQLLGPDTAVVCAMSGNFVQRGGPAVMNKFARAAAAAAEGADLVLELPAAVSLSSAEGFASGAVAVLAAAGVLAGYKATAYPAVGPDVTLAGGTYVEVPVTDAVVDRNLVTAPAWPGDTAIVKEFAKLMGAKIEI